MKAVKSVLASASRDKSAGDSEPSPKGAEGQPAEWICVSAYVRTLEVELGDKRSSKSFPAKELEHGLISLISEFASPESKGWISSVLTFLLEQGRWGRCIDCRTSPYMGPKTKRVSYLLDKINIIFQPPNVKIGKETINAMGKTTTIDGTRVRASAKLDIVTKRWDQEVIDRNVESHPEWFCGPMQVE